MRNAILWTVTAGAAGLLVYFAGARYGAAPTPAAVAAPEKTITREVDAKRADPGSSEQLRMALLEAELASLRQRVAQQEANSAPAPKAEPEEQPLPSEQDVQKQEAEWHAVLAEVEANYQAEHRDARWSQEATGKLTEVLAKLPALGKSVRSIECRSETCRVEVIDDLTGDFAKQLPLLPHQLAGSLPRVQADFEKQPDGTVKRTLYFSRHLEAPET